MTEEEWMASIRPRWMLAQLFDRYAEKLDKRKLRLLACACVRNFSSRLDQSQIDLLECAERMADGLANDNDLSVATREERRTRTVVESDISILLARCASSSGWTGKTVVADTMSQALRIIGGLVSLPLADAVRDIIGNPWQSVILPPGLRICHQCRGSGYDYKPMDLNGRICNTCDGKKRTHTGPCDWLTTDVKELARIAYDIRPGMECSVCHGSGNGKPEPDEYAGEDIGWLPGRDTVCENCDGAGRIVDGRLDVSCLGALADALEEAGMPSELKCKQCKGRQMEWNGGLPGDRSLPPGYIPCTAKPCMGTYPHAVLAHLRSPVPHYRGCWAVDLIQQR